MNKLNVLILLLTCISTLVINAQCPVLIFNEEFEGTELNLDSWEAMNGDGCGLGICNWGNNELQFYSANNALVSEGTLKIVAQRENIGNLNYTSARLRTKGKVDVTYGRIEAKIKMPTGKGLWPAFWMLPTDEVYGGWPQSGEIDIVELLGQEPNKIHGTLHYGPAWPENRSTGKDFVIKNTDFNEGFHEYAVEWSENRIDWLIDGYLYSTKTANDLAGFNWPFDQDFHILLNVAVGGNWPGSPDATTTFPQTMEVDYVRIYDLTGLPAIEGPDEVENMGEGIVYSVSNSREGSVFEWEVPEGAMIVSGDQTSEITVNFTDKSGKVAVKVIDDCEERELSIQVKVQEVLGVGVVLENFDDADPKMTLSFHSGDFTDNFANPDPSGINTSALCGKYIRDLGSLYDVIVYKTSVITNALEFSNEDKFISLDLWTDAPIGTEILLQLENSNTASPENFPTGRHSRYQFFTTKQNEWETITMDFLDRPDGNVPPNAVTDIIILLNPNSQTDNLFYYDNVQILEAQSSSLVDLSLKEKVFKVSPNPVDNRVSITSASEQLISAIRVYDVNGRALEVVTRVNASAYNLDMSQYNSGLYFIEVNGFKGSAEVLKVVKK